MRHLGRRRSVLLIGIALVSSAVAGLWMWGVRSAPERPAAIWAKRLQTLVGTPRGTLDTYLAVTSHSSPLTQCEISEALNGLGLKALQPKPHGDFVIDVAREGLLINAWRGGPGDVGPVEFVDSGLEVTCPKCGTLHLLVRPELILGR